MAMAAISQAILEQRTIISPVSGRPRLVLKFKVPWHGSPQSATGSNVVHTPSQCVCIQEECATLILSAFSLTADSAAIRSPSDIAYSNPEQHLCNAPMELDALQEPAIPLIKPEPDFTASSNKLLIPDDGLDRASPPPATKLPPQANVTFRRAISCPPSIQFSCSNGRPELLDEVPALLADLPIVNQLDISTDNDSIYSSSNSSNLLSMLSVLCQVDDNSNKSKDLDPDIQFEPQLSWNRDSLAYPFSPFGSFDLYAELSVQSLRSRQAIPCKKKPVQLLPGRLHTALGRSKRDPAPKQRKTERTQRSKPTVEAQAFNHPMLVEDGSSSLTELSESEGEVLATNTFPSFPPNMPLLTLNVASAVPESGLVPTSHPEAESLPAPAPSLASPPREEPSSVLNLIPRADSQPVAEQAADQGRELSLSATKPPRRPHFEAVFSSDEEPPNPPRSISHGSLRTSTTPSTAPSETLIVKPAGPQHYEKERQRRLQEERERLQRDREKYQQLIRTKQLQQSQSQAQKAATPALMAEVRQAKKVAVVLPVIPAKQKPIQRKVMTDLHRSIPAPGSSVTSPAPVQSVASDNQQNKVKPQQPGALRQKRTVDGELKSASIFQPIKRDVPIQRSLNKPNQHKKALEWVQDTRKKRRRTGQLAGKDEVWLGGDLDVCGLPDTSGQAKCSVLLQFYIEVPPMPEQFRKTSKRKVKKRWYYEEIDERNPAIRPSLLPKIYDCSSLPSMRTGRRNAESKGVGVNRSMENKTSRDTSEVPHSTFEEPDIPVPPSSPVPALTTQSSFSTVLFGDYNVTPVEPETPPTSDDILVHPAYAPVQRDDPIPGLKFADFLTNTM